MRLLSLGSVLTGIVLILACGGSNKAPPTTTTSASTLVPTSTTAPVALSTPTGGAAAAQTFTDIFAYCKAVVTLDKPDARWAGPAVPDPVLATLKQHLGPNINAAATSWRCLAGKVVACNVGANLPCGQANTSSTPTQPMLSFCAQNPGADMPAVVTGHDTIYSWKCDRTTPTAGQQVFHADVRGFVSEVWYEVTQ